MKPRPKKLLSASELPLHVPSAPLWAAVLWNVGYYEHEGRWFRYDYTDSDDEVNSYELVRGVWMVVE